jgi:hypothetical protein
MESLGKPLFISVNGHEAIVEELILCEKLLKKRKADVIHLDMTLGSLEIHKLTASKVSLLPISSRAKRNILRILPRLREVALNIREKYGISVLAIGKESIPIRIAELTAGAYSIIFAGRIALETGGKILIGLPEGCSFRVFKGGIMTYSLLPAEYDLRGYAYDIEEILEKIKVDEMLNPHARGFRTALISVE